MNRVKQRGLHDCRIAAFAMLTDKSYEEAEACMGQCVGPLDIWEALVKMGLNPRFRSPNEAGDLAMVLLRKTRDLCGAGHWTVWGKGRYLDPYYEHTTWRDYNLSGWTAVLAISISDD